MGGAVSAGLTNDELVDNLLEADYIKTAQIERVFRAVDRAEYFLPEGRSTAYSDLAWKCGHLHLSAPCIYSEVMEGLCLDEGLSFLNLGSGTGYLSTMVGLVLGANGLNHGVELQKDVVQYANKKLEEFKKYSGAVDEFDFCEPKFIQGNCLCLPSDCALYDRVYCGQACPEQYESFMKNLIKVGGILVMPLNDQLLQITRTSETNWEVNSLLPVSFAYLVCPSNTDEQLPTIDIEPMSLQAICRAEIRNILRKIIDFEHPHVKRVAPVKNFKRKRVLKKLMVPLFDSDGSSDDEVYLRLGGERNRNAGRARLRSESDRLINFFMGTYRSNGSLPEMPDANDGSDRNSTEAMETDTTNESTDENNERHGVETEVRAVIEHNPENTDRIVPSNRERDRQEAFCSMPRDIFGDFDDLLNVIRSGRENLANKKKNNQQQTSTTNETNEEEVDSDEEEVVEPLPGNSRNETIKEKTKTKREKFDSGLGDEINESEDEDLNRAWKEAPISSDEDDDDDEEDVLDKRLSFKSRRENKPIIKMRKTCINYDITTDSSSENENKDDDDKKGKRYEEMRMYKSVYTTHMRNKIEKLPLPPILKRYLNLYRD